MLFRKGESRKDILRNMASMGSVEEWVAEAERIQESVHVPISIGVAPTERPILDYDFDAFQGVPVGHAAASAAMEARRLSLCSPQLLDYRFMVFEIRKKIESGFPGSLDGIVVNENPPCSRYQPGPITWSAALRWLDEVVERLFEMAGNSAVPWELSKVLRPDDNKEGARLLRHLCQAGGRCSLSDLREGGVVDSVETNITKIVDLMRKGIRRYLASRNQTALMDWIAIQPKYKANDQFFVIRSSPKLPKRGRKPRTDLST